MSEAQKRRDRAFHARQLARALTDQDACAALEALAVELEAEAAELERGDQGGAADQPKTGDTSN